VIIYDKALFPILEDIPRMFGFKTQLKWFNVGILISLQRRILDDCADGLSFCVTGQSRCVTWLNDSCKGLQTHTVNQ